MRNIILIASLLMAGGLWAEEDSEAVCKIVAKNYEEQLLKCKKGDILSIRMARVESEGTVNVALRACELPVINYGTPTICIYRGSLREVR